MEKGLYEPGLGYYSAGLHKFGAEGDFITAPELGAVFARCLARQVVEIAALLPGEYDIVEAGAGTGRLAADLLMTLGERAPERYRILERSADLRAVQQDTLDGAAIPTHCSLEWLEEPPDTAWSGVLLANEVVDALSVERFRVASGGIEQGTVHWRGDSFGEDWRPAPDHLARAVANLGVPLDDSYSSELCLLLPAWLESVTCRLQAGAAVLIDYGYPRREYYHPQRSSGTLVCHYRHRAHHDPFLYPGLQDISAFVDFTALALAGERNGLDLLGYAGQAMFLMGCGLDQVVQAAQHRGEVEGRSAAEQARRLAMPSAMGERFGVMALGRSIDTSLCGFSLQDWRHRL